MTKKFITAEDKKHYADAFKKVLDDMEGVKGLCFVVTNEEGCTTGLKAHKGGDLRVVGDLVCGLVDSVGEHVDAETYSNLCDSLSKCIKLMGMQKGVVTIGREKLS